MQQPRRTTRPRRGAAYFPSQWRLLTSAYPLGVSGEAVNAVPPTQGVALQPYMERYELPVVQLPPHAAPAEEQAETPSQGITRATLGPGRRNLLPSPVRRKLMRMRKEVGGRLDVRI